MPPSCTSSSSSGWSTPSASWLPEAANEESWDLNVDRERPALTSNLGFFRGGSSSSAGRMDQDALDVLRTIWIVLRGFGAGGLGVGNTGTGRVSSEVSITIAASSDDFPPEWFKLDGLIPDKALVSCRFKGNSGLGIELMTDCTSSISVGTASSVSRSTSATITTSSLEDWATWSVRDESLFWLCGCSFGTFLCCASECVGVGWTSKVDREDENFSSRASLRAATSAFSLCSSIVRLSGDTLISHALVGRMKSATMNGLWVGLKVRYTSLKAFCIFVGAHGRPLMKKNWRSELVLPNPWPNLLMRPRTWTFVGLCSVMRGA